MFLPKVNNGFISPAISTFVDSCFLDDNLECNALEYLFVLLEKKVQSM
jgi:hypothetical protein